MKLTILGSGSSGGVPLIGCECEVCLSSDAKNKRGRCSAMIEVDGQRILIDTSPDLRVQAISNNFKTVDAIIFTHAHADHTHGLDEVRMFNYYADAPIPVYANDDTFKEMITRFSYCFLPKLEQFGWFRPCLLTNEIAGGDELEVAGVNVKVFSQTHGGAGETLGFMFNDKIAYSTDLNELSDEVLESLKGVDVWVVGCLQRETAPTHAHLELVLKWDKIVQPKQLILTHMGHGFDYDALRKELPSHITPAYDGMIVAI